MTKEKFEVLSERDHILQRPSMYIGSTALEKRVGFFSGVWKEVNVVPGLLKIIDEIIDNSVDEYIRTNGKNANKVTISLEKNPNGNGYLKVTVSDNGRGIPVEQVEDKTTNTIEWRPVLAWTRARAGSNFSDDGRVTIGMNGVGSFCTNVFSTSFVGETCDGKQRLKLQCSDNAGKQQFKLYQSGSQGTEVSFVPDFSRFGIKEITQEHFDVIRDRLMNVAVCYNGLTFVLNKEKLAFRNLKTLAAQYGEHNVSYQDDKCILIIGNSGDSQEFRFLSYVNGLNVRGGGTHVDYICDQIVAELRPMITKKFKIDVLPAQIKQNLLLVNYTMNLANPKFDSQTKERITSPKKDIEDHFSGVDFKKLAVKIMATEEIIQPIVESILAKKELAERLALARAQKKGAKKTVVNHIAAQGHNPNDKILFITEGLSAIGQLLNVRDPKTVGGYPLRGKIMNVRGMKAIDIVQNKELSELMAVLNLQLGQKANQLAYGKIAILTDADTDGAQIACLLANFFANWPELFHNGHVYRVETPLVVAKKGKQEKIFYTLDEFKAAGLDGWATEYYKGLGSLDEDRYREVINNPRLIKITANDPKDMDWLDLAFGDDADARKEWLSNAMTKKV